MRALKITPGGKTHLVDVAVFEDFQREVGGFVFSMALGNDHIMILNGSRKGNNHPNRLAAAAAAHLGSRPTQIDVVRGTVLILRGDGASRWRDVDDTLEREIYDLAPALRYKPFQDGIHDATPLADAARLAGVGVGVVKR